MKRIVNGTTLLAVALLLTNCKKEVLKTRFRLSEFPVGENFVIVDWQNGEAIVEKETPENNPLVWVTYACGGEDELQNKN